MLTCRTSWISIAALLTACGGGGGVTEQAPPPALSIAVLSGDGAKVMGHVQLTPATGLTVAARNAQGAGVAGLPLTFSPAPGNAYIDTVTVTTGADGSASWQGFPHGLGAQQIIASTPGAASVTLTLNVTGSPYPHDGSYHCLLPAGTTPATFDVKSASVSFCTAGLGCGSIDPINGGVIVIDVDPQFRRHSRLGGTAVIDAQQRVTISGMAYRYTYDRLATGEEFEAGPFTCTRDG